MVENAKKKIKSLGAYGLALMAFTSVWSFTNICNGFGYFKGTEVIVPWILVFVLYFLPYALMVGELGSVFKNSEGGVSNWCKNTIGPKVAFLAGWIYWVVHMPYISQKPNNIVICLNWIFTGDGSISDFPVVYVQALCLIVFIIAIFFVLRGTTVIKNIARAAGFAMFIMMILYILMIFSAPLVNPFEASTLKHFEPGQNNIVPDDIGMLANMSILILAVGGAEKLAPYVKLMKNPGKDFPKGMILLVVMVVSTAILGTIAINSFYDGQNLPSDFLTNGQYEAFQKIGNFYGIGNTLVTLYAAANAVSMFAVMTISIDAPLRILLGNGDRNFIPKWLLKKNKNGCYINGMKVVSVVVVILIAIPCLGMNDVNQLVKWLIKINSICMPLRYIFVFVAYIALKHKTDQFVNKDYCFIKNKTFGKLIGCWCLFVTLSVSIVGMHSDNAFEFLLNASIPVILCGFGLILPKIARTQLAKKSK